MAVQREARAVSQETVAQQMHLEQPTLSKIERGQRRLTVEELLVWANALGMPTSSVCMTLERLRAEFLRSGSIWVSEDE